jgi:hypothetical protein
MSLVQRYLGDRAKQNRADDAEQQLQTKYYDGKSNRFTFSGFVDAHKDCHQEIAKHGERELTNLQKVQFLLEGITDPSLAAHKAVIYSTA